MLCGGSFPLSFRNLGPVDSLQRLCSGCLTDISKHRRALFQSLLPKMNNPQIFESRFLNQVFLPQFDRIVRASFQRTPGRTIGSTHSSGIFRHASRHEVLSVDPAVASRIVDRGSARSDFPSEVLVPRFLILSTPHPGNLGRMAATKPEQLTEVLMHRPSIQHVSISSRGRRRIETSRSPFVDRRHLTYMRMRVSSGIAPKAFPPAELQHWPDCMALHP